MNEIYDALAGAWLIWTLAGLCLVVWFCIVTADWVLGVQLKKKARDRSSEREFEDTQLADLEFAKAKDLLAQQEAVKRNEQVAAKPKRRRADK
jgi:hypothetical protein